MTVAFDLFFAELDVETGKIRADVKARVAGGTMVRLDGKKPCTAGKWGNNYGATRETKLDPGWCTRNRDRNLPPVLRVPIACADLDNLFWPDIYDRCRALLIRALNNVPSREERWQGRFTWTRRVMELVSMALEATNIQPIFMFPSKWATEHVYKAVGGDGFLIDWGLYSSGWTYDGLAAGWTQDAQTDRLIGGCVPSDIHEFLSKTLEAGSPSPKYGVFWSGAAAYGGVHWGRESTGYTAMTYLPAMMPGSLTADNSQTLQALKGNHDPWTSTGFPEQDPEEMYPAMLPVLTVQMLINSIGRDKTMAPDLEAVQNAELAYRGVPLLNYFRGLFSTSGSEPAAMVRAISPRWNGQPGKVGTRAGDMVDARYSYMRLTPNAQWYVELAKSWAYVIKQRRMADIVADSTLFWLRNHHKYFKRMYGDAIKLSTEDMTTIANAIQASRGALLQAGGQLGAQIVNLLSPIAGAIMGQVSNMVTDAIVQYLSQPELPKPLFRRVSQNMSCDITVGGEQAAYEAVGRQFLERQRAAAAAQPDDVIMRLIASGQTQKKPPWLLIGAGVGAAAIVGAIILRK